MKQKHQKNSNKNWRNTKVNNERKKIKFRNCTKNYYKGKMEQYQVVVNEISNAYIECQLHESPETFEVIKKLIVNNEMLGWRYVVKSIFKSVIDIICDKCFPAITTLANAILLSDWIFSGDSISSLQRLKTIFVWNIIILVFDIAFEFFKTQEKDTYSCRILEEISYEQYKQMKK